MMGWWFVSNLLTGKRPGILYRRSVPDDFAFSSFPLLKFSSPSFLLRMSSSFTTTASVSVYVLPLSLSPASTILSWKNEMRGQEKKSEGTLAGLVVPLRDPLFFFSLGKRMASGGINSAWKPKEVAQRAGFSGRSFTSFYQDRLYPFMEEKKTGRIEKTAGYATDFAPTIDIDLFEEIGMRLVQSKGIKFFSLVPSIPNNNDDDQQRTKKWSHRFYCGWMFAPPLLGFLARSFSLPLYLFSNGNVVLVVFSSSMYVYISTSCFSHASIYPRFMAHRFRDESRERKRPWMLQRSCLGTKHASSLYVDI